MHKIIPINQERSCSGCTGCCEGWLSGEVYGHKYWPGRKCHFVDMENKCCSIYENRPYDSCQTYKCAWLTDPNIPLWLKPSVSGVIMDVREKSGVQYLSVRELGKTMNPEILSWLFISYANGNIKNIAYQLNGGENYVGTQEFVALMQNM